MHYTYKAHSGKLLTFRVVGQMPEGINVVNETSSSREYWSNDWIIAETNKGLLEFNDKSVDSSS